MLTLAVHSTDSNLACAAEQLYRYHHKGQISQHQLADGTAQRQGGSSRNLSQTELSRSATAESGTAKTSRRVPQACSESPSYRAALTRRAAKAVKPPEPRVSNQTPKEQQQTQSNKKKTKSYDKFFKDMPNAEVGWRFPEPLAKLNFTMTEIIVYV